MNTTPRNYTEIASPSILQRIQINPVPKNPVATTIMHYEDVKHLLSSKPLRRPERSARLSK